MPKITDRMHSNAELMRCDVYPSSLGLVLIATSAKGVCAIMFDDDQNTLKEEFEGRFPKTIIAPQNLFSRDLAACVLGLIEGQKTQTPPLDMRGTEFQKRVWRALLEIPYGSTVSYKELAGRAEAPLSIRAVAGACAANPLALVVPCHRVVRHDGALSGYRWGVARKQALLEREGGSTYGPKGIGACFAPCPS